MERFTPDTPCHLCGGTIGSGFAGSHELCHARARRDQPTPCLGHPCMVCNGLGAIDRASPQHRAPIFFEPAAEARYTAARWPKCEACDGKGMQS